MKTSIYLSDCESFHFTYLNIYTAIFINNFWCYGFSIVFISSQNFGQVPDTYHRYMTATKIYNGTHIN